VDQLQESPCCGGGPPPERTKVQSCCGRATVDLGGESQREDTPWIVAAVSTPVGEVPRVSTTLRPVERWGGWKVRWGVGRMRYAVEPGLYAVGRPTADSAVLVSANYKLSFDRLRSQLNGLDAWILVLNSRGINVWCAAGKGTFGTDEIVRRIEAVRLAEVVSHRVLIVPQLGAPGVAAHEVKRQSGFRVQYGPVRAQDLPAFLAAGMKATPEMRRVHFRLRDRAAVMPVELVWSAKYALLIAAGFFLLAGLGPDGYSGARLAGAGLRSAVLILGSWAGSTALTPILLPWLPGRALSAKGAWLGLVFVLVLVTCTWFQPAVLGNWLRVAAWCLLIPTVASFMAMNFTGATTYTSLSGVRREMRVAVPIQAAAAAVGVVVWLIGRFV
jgi:hypothetical protein